MKIKILKEDRNYIQSIHFRKNNLILILNNIKKFNIKIEENRIIQYKNQIKQLNKKFNLAKKEIIENKYLNNKKYNFWSLNYENCELEVIENNDKTS